MNIENESLDPTPQEPSEESTEYRATTSASASATTQPPSGELTVIGLGASAGGLSALRDFFAAMPHDTGMTFVVVVHLSPEHESMLAELLQGYTLMPVTQVLARVKMEPNHVYVIPPGKRLVVTDGHLDLTHFDTPRGPRLQIDTFFRSLAAHYDDGAAIILSGTGSDGAVGIQPIKEGGGIILVQSPEEAEYDGMPRSAIATGLVDIVAPASELALQLAAAKKTKTVLELPSNFEELSTAIQQSLTQIITYLRLQNGHDFSGYKRSTLLRRIARRMQLTQIDDLSGYLARLRQDEMEVSALYRDLLIHVTEFFRDSEAWRYLQEQVVPRLFTGKNENDSVRVWTVGCATGEEAYGIAILLLEYAAKLDKPPHIQVFASDLGKYVLDFAREGVYPEAIAADVSEERLQRFFIQDNNHYAVRPEVREHVLFAAHNLLQDPPFSKLDLVICRNLLIYLQRPVQERVYDSFYYALQPNGFLFLGSAESAEGVTKLFNTLDKQHRVYQRSKLYANTLVLPNLTHSMRALPAGAISGTLSGEITSNLPHNEATQHRILLEELGLPSLLVDDHYHVLHYSESAGRYLQHPAGIPTHDVTRLVRPELRSELQMALYRASSQATPTRTQPVPVRFNGSAYVVTVLVRPTPQRGRMLLLFLEDETLITELAAATVTHIYTDGQNDQLQAELQLTQQRLQAMREEYETTVEELRAANEELQSSNEEYRSTLEELETSKEELQSVNEELQSVNQEMSGRVEEITQANSDLQNLFAATEIATLFLDYELRVKRYTPHASALFNLMPTDRGRPISHLRTNLAYATLEVDAQRVLSTLVPLEREVEGTEGRWFLVGVRPYRTIQDKIDGVVITCVDISAIKSAEEALQGSEERLKTALKASHMMAMMGSWDWDPAQDHVVATDTLTNVLGLLPNQSVTDSAALFALVHPEDADRHHTLVQEAIAQGQNWHDEFRVIRPCDSRTVWVEERASILQDPVSGKRQIRGMTWDITARKEAEIALRHNEERLRVTLASIVDHAIITLDVAGIITEWNPGAEEIFGYSAAEAIGQYAGLIFTPEDRARGAPEREIEQARTTGRAADERWHIRRDGSRVFMSGVLVPLQGDTITGYVKVARDLTERRQLEERLEAMVEERTLQVRELVTQLTMSEQEERRRISAILHDDLQQRLFSHIFQLHEVRYAIAHGDPEGARQTIGEIEEELRSSVQITRDLSVDLSPPILHNEGLVQAVYWLATQMESQYGLRVELQAEEPFPSLDEDLRVLLFQTIRELLFNVVKHAEVNTVTVTFSQAGGQVRISVRDQGKGFTTGTASGIANDKAQRNQGLQRIQQRLQLLEGDIEITSAPGQGTVVTLLCPMQGRRKT
jgi:two-component system CheB/CheR fusion protein